MTRKGFWSVVLWTLKGDQPCTWQGEGTAAEVLATRGRAIGSYYRRWGRWHRSGGSIRSSEEHLEWYRDQAGWRVQLQFGTGARILVTIQTGAPGLVFYVATGNVPEHGALATENVVMNGALGFNMDLGINISSYKHMDYFESLDIRLLYITAEVKCILHVLGQGPETSTCKDLAFYLRLILCGRYRSRSSYQLSINFRLIRHTHCVPKFTVARDLKKRPITVT